MVEMPFDMISPSTKNKSFISKNDTDKDLLPKQIGKQIKDIRIEKGISMVQLSKELELPIAFIEQLEDGLVFPDYKTVFEIQQFLGCRFYLGDNYHL